MESQLTRRTGTSRKRKGSPKDRSSRTKESSKSSRRTKTPKSGKNEAVDSQKVAMIRLRADPEPMDELERIPASEKLEMLDPLSRYEYKIQAVLSLEKLVDPREIADSARDRGDRSPRRSQEASLLGIAPELIAEALQERFLCETTRVTLFLFSFLFVNPLVDQQLINGANSRETNGSQIIHGGLQTGFCRAEPGEQFPTE